MFKLLRVSCETLGLWISKEVQDTRYIKKSRASSLQARDFWKAKLHEALGPRGLVALDREPLWRVNCPRPWAVKGQLP